MFALPFPLGPTEFCGIPVRRAVSLDEARLASSGRTISSLVLYVQGRIVFLTPGSFADYIQPRLTDGTSHEDVLADIRRQIQEQLDRGVAEGDITLN